MKLNIRFFAYLFENGGNHTELNDVKGKLSPVGNIHLHKNNSYGAQEI